MEDVLDVYAKPASGKQGAGKQGAGKQGAGKQGAGKQGAGKQVRLVFDEKPFQLLEEKITPLPMQSQKVLRQDYEYSRKGTACILLAYDLDTHQRYVQLRTTRTKEDYAQFIDWLVKNHYQESEKIHLVQDNLNTHKSGSFYEYLPVERAHQLKNKLIFHYTPKHGSWLNMAEIEFSVMSKQCLDRRIGSLKDLNKQIQAWVIDRNQKKVPIQWLFDTQQARTKLRRHYLRVNSMNEHIAVSSN